MACPTRNLQKTVHEKGLPRPNYSDRPLPYQNGQAMWATTLDVNGYTYRGKGTNVKVAHRQAASCALSTTAWHQKRQEKRKENTKPKENKKPKEKQKGNLKENPKRKQEKLKKNGNYKAGAALRRDGVREKEVLLGRIRNVCRRENSVKEKEAEMKKREEEIRLTKDELSKLYEENKAREASLRASIKKTKMD